MTEGEWLACQDPTPMLEYLRGKASERKLRLFACDNCREFWPTGGPLSKFRLAFGIAERAADGCAPDTEREAAYRWVFRTAVMLCKRIQARGEPTSQSQLYLFAASIGVAVGDLGGNIENHIQLARNSEAGRKTPLRRADTSETSSAHRSAR